MNSILELNTGQKFTGKSFGTEITNHIISEIVFQTGMVGYPESLTDPSYLNQILVLTYPLIGNYGIGESEYDEYGIDKFFESNNIHIKALIVGEYNPKYSHWKGKRSLGEWLKEKNIIGISGIDTRELVKIIRENQDIIAKISTNLNKNNSSDKLNNISIEDINKEISSTNVFLKMNPPGKIFNGDKIIINENPNLLNILVIDCGIKNSQLRALLKRNIQLTVVDLNYNFINEVFNNKYNGIFISNGPGNPIHSTNVISQLKQIFTRNHSIPIFGICYGHQLIGLAGGFNVEKMKYGNRGHNIPCNLVGTEKCYITSQNHGYEVLLKNNNVYDNLLNWKELFVNCNDGSNEGLISLNKPIFSVQFHPEARAGPTDTTFLFDIFIDRCKSEFSINDRINSRVKESIKDSVEYVNNIKNKISKILILGSGGLSIGQAGEFDYSGSQAIKAFKEENIEVILINPNIATIQTSKGLADKIYYLPVTSEYVKQVIDKEKPDGISLSFGGQTALNCGVDLYQKGYLEDIKILGSSLQTVMDAEDRERFKNILEEIGEHTAPSKIANNMGEALEFSKEIGFPLLIRSSFALGGLSSGFANNKEELINLLTVGFKHCSHVIMDKSLKGWKELEYEIVRDSYDNCISVCNMENIDPLGIHTGESIVVAPSQTLTDKEYNCLRRVAFKVIRRLGIIGECNIQYALDPESSKYYIIEVNPRLSRSSALASKATGYPLAYIAAKLSLGYSLLEIKNSITRLTACYEPSLDYCVIKVPRWDLRKFPMVNDKLGSSMKSVGEVMSISRSFEEALQKALRMANENILGFYGTDKNWKSTEDELKNPNQDRINKIANSFYSNQYDVDKMYELTKIDKWYLKKMWKIIEMQKELERIDVNDSITKDLLYRAKRIGFSDYQISKMIKKTEIYVRNFRESFLIKPVVKQLDTVAAEYPCYTNYLYLTYNGDYHDITFDEKTVIVLGSGVYRIGSSVEFDWCAVNCVRELRKMGYNTVMINFNPETVSTDYDEVDRLYFDEISFESVMDIYGFENCQGIVLSMGGQIANNIAMSLHRLGVKIIGTSPENIDKAENRFKFSRMLDQINIDQPKWKELSDSFSSKQFCNEVGYPCLVRPSYVLSGAMMSVIYSDEEMEEYLKNVVISNDYPVVISKFITDAKEIEVDAVADNGILKLWAISEHVEDAGIHSGDATLILPPKNINEITRNLLMTNTQKIAKKLEINGPFNIQYIAKNNEIKVIECNLRVSRSFPFVSKVKDINFIKVATRIMTDNEYNIEHNTNTYTGVKVSQFSFNRLANADSRLGVEMLSTGEVACFGKNYHEAYLKALSATGFKVKNNCNVILSIGSYQNKKEMHNSVELLSKGGFKIYGTYGTANYYSESNINVIGLDNDEIYNKIKEGFFGLVINISIPNKIRVLNKKTNGYYIRRLAIDYGISVITNIKCAKLYIESVIKHYNNSIKISDSDVKTTNRYIKLPMLIDMHVHVREPGGEQKETWDTCSKAALKGGNGLICAMPNTNPSCTNEEIYNMVNELAKAKSVCDYMIFLGADGENYKDLEKMNPKVCAIKFYLNETYSTLKINNISVLRQYFIHCPDDMLMCFHSEVEMVGVVLFLASIYKKRVHICHISRKEEIEMIKDAKNNGINVTCEVTPHHLFLNDENVINLDPKFRTVKPILNSDEDKKALWDNLDIIDCFATDHAPHLKTEKKSCGCPGFTGLETALPLLLNAVNENRLTIKDIIDKYHHNPKKILGLNENYGQDSFIEINLDKEYTIRDEDLITKAGWSPFNNFKVKGCLERFVYKNECVYNNGLAKDLKTCQNVNIYKNKNNSNCISLKSELDNNVNNIENEELGVYKLNSIINVEQFNRNNLRLLFKNACILKNNIKKNNSLDILKGKVIGLYFDEPSTRTYGSFSVAVQKLGGSILSINKNNSSTKKDESLYDTLKCFETYCDLIVIRTSVKNTLDTIKNKIKIPIINAGDGDDEHPTQALLDIFTIREERGTVNNLVVSIVGDLKYGRTVHSLVKLLSIYDITFNFVSISDLELDENTIQFLDSKQIKYNKYNSINDIIEHTDVLYMTRIQKERLRTENIDYEFLKNNLYLTQEMLTNAKNNIVIMHPLPRNEELNINIDNDPRAAYFRQMENGLYIRMALLQSFLGNA
jgi:carbamoyl-phosphate synthase / aspartate carbamoyltransferase / dihydroorotase